MADKAAKKDSRKKEDIVKAEKELKKQLDKIELENVNLKSNLEKSTITMNNMQAKINDLAEKMSVLDFTKSVAPAPEAAVPAGLAESVNQDPRIAAMKEQIEFAQHSDVTEAMHLKMLADVQEYMALRHTWFRTASKILDMEQSSGETKLNDFVESMIIREGKIFDIVIAQAIKYELFGKKKTESEK